MEMPIDEKIIACRDFRRRGNLFHKEGQYRRGALQYRQVGLSLHNTGSLNAILLYRSFSVVEPAGGFCSARRTMS